jgi:purine-binding chemotaxis protein CheW
MTTTNDNAGADRKIVTFSLAQQTFGIDMRALIEIREWDEPTPLPNVPGFIKGVTNLRGVIVPIVDLRLKFDLGNVRYDHQTVVIILNVAGRVVGIVVDGVSDVLTLTGDDIKPAPEFGVSVSNEHLTGLGSVEGRMLILIDIERMMTSSEMELVEAELA